MTRPVESQWLTLQARYAAASDALTTYRMALTGGYGDYRYAKRSELARLEKLSQRCDRCSNAIFGWLAEHSPRQWLAGVPAWWICTKLTYADALTSGALSVMPPVPYGGTPASVAAFAREVKP